MIFTSCGAAPHRSGCGGRQAADFAPRILATAAGDQGRAIAAAWAPGGERRELLNGISDAPVDPILLSSGECGAVFYFFGARAAGTGPRRVVPVVAVEKSPVWARDFAPRPFFT